MDVLPITTPRRDHGVLGIKIAPMKISVQATACLGA
jgi:hypothetical protein